MRKFIAERISDGTFLDLDLPITVDGVGEEVSGAGKFSGTIDSDIGALKDADGNLLLDPRATFIHVEESGEIRHTYLLTRSQVQGETWSLEGVGFSAYPNGTPYTGEYRGVQVDPVEVMRHLWQHVQLPAGGSIGVTLTGSSSVRVGTISDEDAKESKRAKDAAKKALDAKKKQRLAKSAERTRTRASHKKTIDALQAVVRQRINEGKVLAKNKAPASQQDAKKAQVAAARAAVKAAQTTRNNAIAQLTTQYNALYAEEKVLSARYKTASEQAKTDAAEAKEDGGAHKILWWDSPDCGQAIMDALDLAGMEFYQHSAWNAEKTAIRKEIRVVPTVGKQSKAWFIQGENTLSASLIEDDSEGYANSVTVIGAGEGRDALRITDARPDSRRRSPVSVNAKDVTSKAVLKRIAERELAARSRRLTVKGLEVLLDHPNAPAGTWGVGDIVMSSQDMAHLGRRDIPLRIMAINWQDDKALLETEAV